MNGNFNRALKHLAELSAISRLSDFKSSVQEIVLQVAAVADPFSLKSVSDFHEALDAFFGIPVELSELEEAITFLVGGDRLARTFGALALSDTEQKHRSAQIVDSRNLELTVYENWRKDIVEAGKIGHLSFETLKKCMSEYLGRAFRQHGIETAQILDAGSAVAREETESLVHVLNSVVSTHFKEKADQASARILITQFFSAVEAFPERRRFLIELADGAYSFFTFFIDPEVATRLREALRKIEFFLDTNYLWGLLGLHENQYVDASVELFVAVRARDLSFSFRYHKITEQELLRSIAKTSETLRKKA